MVKVIPCPISGEKLVRTEEDESNGFSFLKIVNRVDKLPQDYSTNEKFQKEVFYLLTHTNVKIGFVLRFVVRELETICGPLFDETFEIDCSVQGLRFKEVGFEQRNEQLARIARQMFLHSKLEGIKGWRDEKYAIYDFSGPYVLLERAMAGLMGIITYGIHINGYVLDDATRTIKFWIPRRSATKSTWPLMLDNIIAGGLGYPCTIYETVFKEAKEEANIDRGFMESNVKAAGVVSYLCFLNDFQKADFSSESDFIVGEVEYIYDLKLPADIIPAPNDGEVDSFNLMSLQQTVNALVNGEFKPNCALVMVDFLVRHGFITPDNEPNYLQLVSRMHRTLPFPTIN
ncbi:hypothetical protein HG536_0C06410 [Torulaspora globosa]|uniref:Nudix hydrolase domain-containing protein n=1 Tax=Torulaspora globosa TaxID=48254 RepID=A0A7G3ZG36_9SACH|nr:uncharacterized protein HG536_0C06410 [Torulaspora globosa]QLL32472.1 hypothetical protein HG536_0C06410 [Torulaspora globosa]